MEECNRRSLAAAMAKFLTAEHESSNYPSDKKESLQVAIQCLQHVYDLETDAPRNVPDLLALVKSTSAEPLDVSAEDASKAEALKTTGNDHMKVGRHEAAIQAYTEAIRLDARQAVYYSNRAAAMMALGRHGEAVEDCREATRKDPSFAKAYRRLGAACTALKQEDEAIEAYKECLAIDPSDSAAQSALDALQGSTASSRPQAGRGAGSPFGAGAGGMPDIASLLNNPQMMAMAQQMMQSGALGDMMKDPGMMNMMQGFMAGGAAPSSPKSATVEEMEEEE